MVAKINQAPASASAPENVTSEDITNSVSNADDTTPAPQDEQFVDMVKRVLSAKIDMLKVRYETAMTDRIKLFNTKYNLGPDEMKCINVLKAAVLADLIKKKEELMKGIMANPNVNRAIDTAKNAAEGAAAGTEFLRGTMNNFLGQNPKTEAAVSDAKDQAAAAVSRVGSSFRK